MTIREIAALAGVAKSTVSKVLNNRPGVGEHTRRRVLEIIRDTRYRPSSSARALALSRTENIALVIPRETGLSLSGAFWSVLTSSIAHRAAGLGYRLILLISDGGDESLIQDLVSHRRADGLIFGVPGLSHRILNYLNARGFPFLIVGRQPGWEKWSIDVDNAGGARDMTAYMSGQGYRKIAMITGPEELFHMRERARGYREALGAAGLESAGLVHADFDEVSVDTAVGELMDPHVPDALFIGSGGEYLLHALQALDRRNIDRHRMGIAVFDDYPYLDFTDPGITAVRQPVGEMGAGAVDILADRIQGMTPSDMPRILATRIIPRRSCGETPRSDPGSEH